MTAVWKEFFIGLVPPAALVFASLGSILFNDPAVFYGHD